jgi:hypothetical protein
MPGRGEYPRGQQDEASREGEGHGVDRGGDQHAGIRVFGEPAKDTIHSCSLPPHGRPSGWASPLVEHHHLNAQGRLKILSTTRRVFQNEVVRSRIS